MKSPASLCTLHIATDHAGFAHKEALVSLLKGKGFNVVDHGALSFDEDDDFPDFVSQAARAVSLSPEDTKAIILGGSGNGEAIMANRYPGVRAAVYYGGAIEIVKLSREHNDANILSVGARFVSFLQLEEAVALWLETKPLTDEKYSRRNKKIEFYTKNLRPL